MSFREDMRRFAGLLREAEALGIKHWNVGLCTGYREEGGEITPTTADDKTTTCGCLIGGAVIALVRKNKAAMKVGCFGTIENKLPSFARVMTRERNKVSHDISEASEAGVDFIDMVCFIDGTPDWAFDALEAQ
jgi:hypothetical protein